MNKEYHMYDATSPKFQDKEINIPDNKIIDDDVLPPPTRKFHLAYSTLYDKFCNSIQQAYGRNLVEPEKVEGMRHAYGHTDMIGDCPACGLTVYKRINTCYCGACGQRIKWNEE